MKRHTKLTAKEQEQQAASHQEIQQAGGALEFTTPEAMLRHDALHTPVPPAIGHRLQASTAQLPQRPQSWWKRLFGG